MLAVVIFLIGVMSQAQTPPPLPANPGQSQNPNQIPPPPAFPAMSSAPEVTPTQPLLAPLPPSLSGAKSVDKKKDQSSDRIKSPFMLPKEIYLRLVKKRVDVPTESVIDFSVAAARRWP